MKLIECVPNVSEGRRADVINALARTIKSVDGVKLLGVDGDADANRTVFTFAGAPEAVLAAAYALTEKVSEFIDMRVQHGVHPRLGAVDVCPFIPVQNVSLDDCDLLAKRLALDVNENLKIPVYLYEHSAATHARKNLAFIRRGQYESLPQKLTDLPPDFPAPHNARFGALITGARNFLIAFNVNLKTKDVHLAQKIAEQVRESGTGKKIKSLKAIGWYLEHLGMCQVSCNLTNYHECPPIKAFREIKETAATFGVETDGSQLVGLIPSPAFTSREAKEMGLEITEDKILENKLTSLF